jgi:LysR family nod box-dependent transcriptional activator
MYLYRGFEAGLNLVRLNALGQRLMELNSSVDRMRSTLEICRGDVMNLAQVDLNLLVALDALLDERNVTRAGDKVGLSQPAMSSTLSRLRRLFQDELLVREGRGYQLTPLAQELEAPLQEILHLIDQTIERRPVFDATRGHRNFTLVATDHIAFLLLQPLFEYFRTHAPGVTLQIRPLVPPATGIDLAQTDLVFGHEQMLKGAESQELYRDRWVCVVWSGNKRVGEMLTLKQYLSVPHLGYGPSVDGLTGLADRAASTLHPRRHVSVSVETFFLMPFLLRGTRLIAFMHERVARQLAPLTDIRIVEPPFEVPILSEVMFWHPRFTNDSAHTWLRGQVAHAATAISASMAEKAGPPSLAGNEAPPPGSALLSQS